MVRWSDGAEGRLPRLAQRRVILFFCPIRGFVAEPKLYVAGIGAMPTRDRRQYRRPVFLKASTAPAA